MLRNTVLSPAAGSNCANNTDPRCTSLVPILRPELTIHKSADTTQVVAGGTVRYTLSATNTGEAPYPTAHLTDPLGDVLDDAGYNNDATSSTGTLTYSGETLSWTGPLAVGQSVIISYSVTTAVQDDGNGLLTNRVSSLDVGSNCPVGSTDPACTATTEIAARTLLLTDLTPGFTLTGLPGSTVTADGAVTMTVTTNSPGGYTVTVQATTTSLTAGTPGNTGVIPVGNLRVRESGTSAFFPLTNTQALVVHRQGTPSGPGGDAVSNDFQVQIPDVPSDTYSTSLDYIATAQ